MNGRENPSAYILISNSTLRIVKRKPSKDTQGKQTKGGEIVSYMSQHSHFQLLSPYPCGLSHFQLFNSLRLLSARSEDPRSCIAWRHFSCRSGHSASSLSLFSLELYHHLFIYFLLPLSFLFRLTHVTVGEERRAGEQKMIN